MPTSKREEGRNGDLRSSVVTLDLSDKALRRIEALPDGVSAQTILYNHNNIARIENLQYFEHLQQLSLANNRLVEMTGISQAQGLKVLDLSNNSIISIEGLTHLRSLEWLNLSGNSIKRMQNLEKNINLYHLDVSDNSIVKISSLRNLMKLKTLLLHGNLISSLRNITENVSATSVVTLSLGDNEILDLNEMTNLKSLSSLEQLSIAGNPCLLSLSNVIGFNYRPFILVNCPKLRNLDGHLVSQQDRLESEKLRNDGYLKTFSSGRHLQLVKYLTQATPIRNSKTPTPAMDSISRHDDRWSVPVRDDRPSKRGHDLTLEDITNSEIVDDQLVSESCYVPISDSQSIMSSVTGDFEDYHVTERPNHTNNSNGQQYDGVGLTVETPDEEGSETIDRKSPIQEDGLSNQDESSQPLMTEEEAFKLIHLAATIIQARVRGFLTRRKLDFYEYRHRKKAAILIQAVWKGYRTRMYNKKVIAVRNEIRMRRLTAHVNYLASLVIKCQDQASRDKRTMAKAIKCLWSELEKQNSRYVSWLHIQQNRAAVKIQRHWRGYKVRKLYPRPTTANVTSYRSMVLMCRDMQEQIDLLRKQVDILRLDKSVQKSAENTDQEEPCEPRSIPAIRIIRPSVCILPELELDDSTKEHLKQQGNFESVLDDVDIEPLDIGEYDQLNNQDVCNTTFDVENVDECGNKTDDSEDEEITEHLPKRTKPPTDENNSCVENNSKFTDPGSGEEDNQEASPASSCESEEFASSTVKEIDVANEQVLGQKAVVVDTSFSDKNDKIDPSENKHAVHSVESEIKISEGNDLKHDQDSDVSGTTSPSIQADVSLSSDASHTSDSSNSPTKSDSGRKKKKLLLRSTSADQVPRLRSLHAWPSLDSDRLSSSLNFDSRLSQRSASFLKEFKNEIASLTARHLSKEDFSKLSDDDATGKIGTDSFERSKHYNLSEPSDGKTDIHAVSDNTLESKPDLVHVKSDDLSSHIAFNRKENDPFQGKVGDIPVQRSDHIPNQAEISQENTEPVADKVDTFRKEVPEPSTGFVKEIPHSGFLGDGAEEDFPPKETGACRDPADISRKQAAVFGDQVDLAHDEDTALLDNNSHSNCYVSLCESAKESNDTTEHNNDKQQSFTMPVFDDVEASLSLEDFMEDSLEERET